MANRWLNGAVLCLALVPSAWLAWRWRHGEHLGIYHDDAIYLVTAKSLAEENGYRIASLPGEPYQTKYPPLFPALLSLIWRADPSFPGNLPKMALLDWAFLVAAVLLTWRLTGSVGLPAFLALSPVAVQHSILLMSEVPFLALVLVSLVLAERNRGGAAGLVGALTFLTRSAALPLLITTPLLFVWRRQFRQAALFAVAMAPAVLAWQVWSTVHRAPADPLTLFYTDYFGFLRHDVPLGQWIFLPGENAGPAVKAIGDLLVFDVESGFVAITLARLLTFASISGCVRLVREGRLTHYAWFGALYTVQLLCWNYPPTARFFLPLLPLVAAGAWREWQSLRGIISAAYRKKGADRMVAVAACGFVGFVAFSSLRGIATGLHGILPPVLQQRAELLAEKQDAYRWISANTSPAAAVVSYQDPLDYLYTGRRGYSLRVPPGVLKRGDRQEIDRCFAQLPDLMAAHGVEHVLLTDADYQMDLPSLTLEPYRSLFAKSGRFERVFEHRGTAVYRARSKWAYDKSP
jgi:hypothetical protein